MVAPTMTLGRSAGPALRSAQRPQLLTPAGTRTRSRPTWLTRICFLRPPPVRGTLSEAGFLDSQDAGLEHFHSGRRLAHGLFFPTFFPHNLAAARPSCTYAGQLWVILFREGGFRLCRPIMPPERSHHATAFSWLAALFA